MGHFRFVEARRVTVFNPLGEARLQKKEKQNNIPFPGVSSSTYISTA
jgi:hypothetical protein